METSATEAQNPTSPVFSYWRWLLLSFLLLIPFALVIGFIIMDMDGIFEFFIRYPEVPYIIVVLAAFLGGFLQWIYFHFQFRRAWSWPFMQVFVYILSLFLFTSVLRQERFLLTRNFSVWVRLGSSALVLLAFLLPPALIHFGVFRSRKIPLGWGWFRDYALVFALGLVVFLIYDWFTAGRASPIPGMHGALYTGMITFALYLSAGQGWVITRLRFPPLMPKLKKAKTKATFDYFTASWKSRFLYWFKGLAIPGVFLFFVLIFCFYYTVGLPFPIPFVIFSSCLFFLVEWGLFRKIIKIQYWIFLLSAVCLPLAYWILLSLHIPVGEGFDIYLLVLLIACLLIGIIHHVGLGKLYPRVNILFFTYFLTSIAICLVIIKVISKALLELDNPFYWDIFTVLILVFFPNLIALLLTYFINPQDILLVLDNESNSQEIDLLRKGEEND